MVERFANLSRRTLVGAAAVTAMLAPCSVATATTPRTGRNNVRKRAPRSGMPRRFAFGGFIQESNTFCPALSTSDFFAVQRGQALLEAARVPDGATGTSFIGGAVAAIEAAGVEAYPTLYASSFPYGVVERSTYEGFKAEIVKRLAEAPPLDGVVFAFHGAMVSQTTMDPEGDLLAAIREVVGPDVPICCTFDLHCKVSQRMIDNGDAFFYNNENPHRDSYQRGAEAAENCVRIARGEIRPVMAFSKPGMMVPTLNVRPPESGPLVDIFEHAFELEKHPDVININIGAGFPWSDVPDAGMHVVVVTDNDAPLAEKIAQDISDRLWAVREEFIPTDLVEAPAAVSAALAQPKGPNLLFDVADNPGDGTTMDSNSLLRELVRQSAKRTVFASICQPELVRQCAAAGVGARLAVDVGDPYHVIDGPLRLEVEVRNISDGKFVAESSPPGNGNRTYDYGRTVVLRHGGIDILVAEKIGGAGINLPALLERNGLDPMQCQIIVLKTFKMYSEPFYSGLAHSMVQVDTRGQAPIHLAKLDWKYIQRPMFPIDKV